MQNAGLPLTTEATLTYTEVIPRTRLEYTLQADFIPGVEPYEVGTRVEFHSSGTRVRMVLTFDPMHDRSWTKRAVLGRESELGKQAQVLKRRRA